MIDLDLQVACDGASIPDADQFLHWVEAALAGQRDTVQLTIRVTDREEMQTLNRTWCHHDRPTNVLSFTYKALPGVDVPLLGDIVICAEVVAKEAAEQGKGLEAHWAHMVLHGCLHLLGYEHSEDRESAVMEGLEIKLLTGLGYTNPYHPSPA